MACKFTYRGRRYDTLQMLVNGESLQNRVSTIIRSRFGNTTTTTTNNSERASLLKDTLDSMTKAEVEDVLEATKTANTKQASDKIADDIKNLYLIKNDSVLAQLKTALYAKNGSISSIDDRVKSLNDGAENGVVTTPLYKAKENVSSIYDSCAV